jgi:hypothetical protein
MSYHCSTNQMNHTGFHRYPRPPSPLLIKRYLFPSQIFRTWRILRLMKGKTSLSTLPQYVGSHNSKPLVPRLVIPRPRAPTVIFAFHTRSYEGSQLLLLNLTAMGRKCRPTLASICCHPARGFLAQQVPISTFTGRYRRKLKNS